MKNKLLKLMVLAGLLSTLLACMAPHQQLKSVTTPGELQKPNGCVMQSGYCKPAV